jgi:hypothetical protein
MQWNPSVGSQVSTAQGTGIVITKKGNVLIIFIHIYRCPPGDNDYGTEPEASRFCKASQHLSARVLPSVGKPLACTSLLPIPGVQRTHRLLVFLFSAVNRQRLNV